MFAHLTCQGPRAPAGPALGPGSFRRIVDVPFETCVTELDSWQQAEQGGEVRFGDSLLCGSAERDPGSATYRIQVRLARGALRPLLRMRIDIDRWSSSSTALELIPAGHVRPTAAYFRAGHLLLDSLTRHLLQPSLLAQVRDTAQPATRARRCRASLIPPRAALASPAAAFRKSLGGAARRPHRA